MSETETTTPELRYNIQASRLEVATALARSILNNTHATGLAPSQVTDVATSVADRLWDHYQIDGAIEQEEHRKRVAVQKERAAMDAVAEEKKRLSAVENTTQ